MRVTASPEYTTPQPATLEPATPQPQKTRRGWFVPGIVGLVVGFALGAGAVVGVQALSSPAADSEQQQILSVCHEAVKDRLKAPATARFSKEEITNENTYVRGAVDSENGFGALIRGTFTCTMLKQDSDGKWKATDVQLDN